MHVFSDSDDLREIVVACGRSFLDAKLIHERNSSRTALQKRKEGYGEPTRDYKQELRGAVKAYDAEETKLAQISA